MRRKHSILRVIVVRFIGYSIGTELCNSVLESIFSTLVYGAQRNYPYDGIPRITAGMETRQIVLIVLWGLLQLAIYCTGVALFARSIRRKIAEPARHMAAGFHEVSSGNLDASLDFDTETEFGEMRDAFNLMARKLKDSEANRIVMENERMLLFSHIAHDLKTPMTTITGYAGALAGNMVAEPEKQREYHLAIKTKTDQMNGLIDQLLAYSKLGAPKYQMKLTRVDAAELLRAACAAMFGEMEKRRIELKLQLPEKPIYCSMDPLEMNRAIGNLLTNAIVHNPPGSLLYVGLLDEPDDIIIQIADSGAVIPEAIAEKLFEPFVSGSASRSSGSGTGLGLAIVKKVVEQHAGEICLANAATPYTKMFVMKLPKTPLQK